jgi:hypothetical protein
MPEIPRSERKTQNRVIALFTDEQTAIASVLTEMDAELAVLEQRREKTRALKQAMMPKILTGRAGLASEFH